MKNHGEQIGKRVRFTGRELLVATNRPTNNLGYQRLEQAFKRLRGTTFKTDIRTGNKMETRIFGMIDEGGFVTVSYTHLDVYKRQFLFSVPRKQPILKP